jgi:hypothetical protein
MTINDWTTHFGKIATAGIRAEDKGSNAIVDGIRAIEQYVSDQQAKGNIDWLHARKSDEAFKTVIADVLSQAGCHSSKGLRRGTSEWQTYIRHRNFWERATRCYRAVSLLASEHNVNWDSDKGLFPVVWFLTDKQREKGTAYNLNAMSAFKASKATIAFVVTDEAGDHDVLQVAVNEAALLRAITVPQQRQPQTADKADGNNAEGQPKSLKDALASSASMLATADYKVTGEAADTLLDMLTAYVAASDANMAAVMGIIEQAKRDKVQASQAVNG